MREEEAEKAQRIVCDNSRLVLASNGKRNIVTLYEPWPRRALKSLDGRRADTTGNEPTVQPTRNQA